MPLDVVKFYTHSISKENHLQVWSYYTKIKVCLNDCMFYLGEETNMIFCRNVKHLDGI